VREARQQAERAGLKPYVQVVDTKEGKRTRVRVGPYATRAEAEKAAAALQKAATAACARPRVSARVRRPRASWPLGHVNQQLYDALTVLQHRGQDAAGIVTCDQGVFKQRKANGLVRDVFRSEHMERLSGSYGIGHVRYPTAGSASAALAQPFYVNSPYGISLAHNGNLTNSVELRAQVFQADLRHINTDSDSEVLLNVFAHELQILGKLVPDANDIFTAVAGCTGARAAATR
jgi:hypothetical protein